MADMIVIGRGTMGRAYAERLSQRGSANRVLSLEELGPGTPAKLVVAALFDGAESRLALSRLPSGCVFVDLTTQSAPDCDAATKAAAATGIVYHAGGVTGGEADARQGRLLLLLGPPPAPELLLRLAPLGAVRSFPSACTAVQAKLLHNFVLLLQAQVLGAAAVLAESVGVSSLGELLDEGTAGRRPSRSSILRDWHGPAQSSYSLRLARKDISAIGASFPALSALGGLDVPALAAGWDGDGSIPYTEAILTSAQRALAKPPS